MVHIKKLNYNYINCLINMDNIYNILLTTEDIEKIINTYIDIPIYIDDISVYQNAFIHKSFCNTDSYNSDSDNCSVFIMDNNVHNERLEFLGDKVIDFITTVFLYYKYPDKNEGFLTKLKSRMVKKESLSKLGDELGFKKYILIDSHMECISGRNNSRILEDIFESFMASLYINTNIDICKQFLIGVYNKHIDFDNLININDNYKDSILRYFQSQKWGHPVYTTFTDINKEFVSYLLLSKNVENFPRKFKPNNMTNGFDIDLKNNIIIGIGKSHVKKTAEQECSKDCLLLLNISLNY